MSEADDLYALPPDEFVAARNKLAARLKEKGRAEEAADVKALRRPSLALWAVNQVARRYPDEMQRVVVLGDELRAAQVEGRREDFRRAARQRSSVLRSLLERVPEVLAKMGASSAHVARAGQTIEAAAADEEARTDLLAGALRRELEPAGFGDVFGSLAEEPAPAPARETKRRKEAEAARRRADVLADRAQEARRDAAVRAREAEEAEAHAVALRRAADRAARKAEKAETEAEQAAQRADDLLG